MKRRTSEHLIIGRKALLKVGSPVRQWVYTLDDVPKPWLTPVRYRAASVEAIEPTTEPQYVEVTIVKVILPFAIVCHHVGRECVRLWLDTREVPLSLLTPAKPMNQVWWPCV
jgi:hypothetical protein